MDWIWFFFFKFTLGNMIPNFVHIYTHREREINSTKKIKLPSKFNISSLFEIKHFLKEIL